MAFIIKVNGNTHRSMATATRFAVGIVVHNHLIGGGFGCRLEADGVVRAET
jgi:hypothetical protein